GDDLAARNDAARGALASPACEHPHDPGGRAACGHGITIVADVDHPVAVADGQAAKRDAVVRIEPALRKSKPDVRIGHSGCERDGGKTEWAANEAMTHEALSCKHSQ